MRPMREERTTSAGGTGEGSSSRACDEHFKVEEFATVHETQVVTEAWRASGGWVGTKATSGSTSVSPRQLGATTYALEARNTNGTTTTQVNIALTRPAALVVTSPGGLHLAGKPITR